MNYNIIVSRFNEDISWTKQFKNVIIYNKGEDNIDEYNPIKLKNVGREGHTYYKYIYDNYNNLADYTIFLQGNPFDHCKTIIEDINDIINDPNFNKEFQYFSNFILQLNLKNDYNTPIQKIVDVKTHTHKHLIDYAENFPNTMPYWFGDKIRTRRIKYGYEKYIDLPLLPYYRFLFKDEPSLYNNWFGSGALFIVNKNTIHKRSKELYKKIYSDLEYSKNPLEGHIIERFHPYIFNILIK
jgi:hypothetical protein